MDYKLIANPQGKVHFCTTVSSIGPLCVYIKDITTWTRFVGPAAEVTCGRCHTLAKARRKSRSID
jgi:hypothetical protein